MSFQRFVVLLAASIVESRAFSSLAETITEFVAGTFPAVIATGPDGNLCFTDYESYAVEGDRAEDSGTTCGYRRPRGYGATVYNTTGDPSVQIAPPAQ